MKKRIKINKISFPELKVTIALVITTFLTVVSSTYAYYYYAADNRNTITGNMATVNLDLEVTMLLPTKESTSVMVPQKSTSGNNSSALSTALKNGCVDDNKNIVCQVYRIRIKNDGGTATEIVDGSISFYANREMTDSSSTKMPNLKWKLITSVDTTNNNNSILGTNIDNAASGTPAKFAEDIRLETNDVVPFYMIIWFNETNNDQIDQDNTFYGKVSFESSNGTGVTATFY